MQHSSCAYVSVSFSNCNPATADLSHLQINYAVRYLIFFYYTTIC